MLEIIVEVLAAMAIVGAAGMLGVVLAALMWVLLQIAML